MRDTEAVSGILFDPMAPLFLRAAQEIGLNLKSDEPLSPENRLKLAKAAGAIYSIVLSVRQTAKEGGSWEIVLDGTDVSTGKGYTDTYKYQQQGVAKGDVNAVQSSILNTNNSVVNAVNTLLLRLLAGPLGEYGRVAPPREFLPPPVTKPTLTATMPTEEEEKAATSAAYEQGRQLLEQGDSNACIVLLRKAINRNPLDSRLRGLLTRAYVAAKRGQDAASEARRALLIAPPPTPEERQELTRLVAEAFTLSGDVGAAQRTYLQIIAVEPNSMQVNWARMALADTYIGQGKTKDAITQYRAILNTDPINREATIGIARIYAQEGDFAAALGDIAPQKPDGTSANQAARHNGAVVLFEVAAPELAQRIATNRKAWEGKQISREVLYNATKAQAIRTAALVAMLKSSPPDAPKNSPLDKQHTRRILAASLLAQATTSLIAFLETSEEDSGAQSALCLLEFQREFNALRTQID
jgi:tetratricopeptide (TPR) repeat protein